MMWEGQFVASITQCQAYCVGFRRDVLSKPVPTTQVYLLYLCKSTIFVKKDVIKCFFLDKTPMYLYNGVRPTGKYTYTPPFPPK